MPDGMGLPTTVTAGEAPEFRQALRAIVDDPSNDLVVAVDADLVQLNSDAQRSDARRFYLSLEVADSHVGLKWKVPHDS